MKTYRTVQSALFTQLLRQIWEKPVPSLVSSENSAFPRHFAHPLSESPPPETAPDGPGIPVAWQSRYPTEHHPRSGMAGGFRTMLLGFAFLLLLSTIPALAQTGECLETNVVKYVQTPQLDGGYALWDSGPWALADDFPCTNTGPITDIHLWGAFLNDVVDINTTFWLAIYDDVPAVTNGPVIIPSRPGTNLIWQQYFFPGQYVQSQVAIGIDQFIDPGGPAPMGNASKIYYYCFYPTNPPVQTGTVTQAKIYWLAVYAQTSQGTAMLFGWQSSKSQQFDISTRTPWLGVTPITTDWRPNYSLNNQPLDLAFKINTATNPPPPCCPETNGVKYLQRPQIPGGMDVNASQALVLADDFRCTNTGPITDIHLWGSWLSDNVDPNVVFTLSIWSDVPKQTNATGVLPSHPGVPLWTQRFGPTEYYQCLYSNVTEPFFDPSIPNIIGADSKVYYLCFYPTNPFVQTGTTAAPTNYWVSVNAQTTVGSQMLFGWHTSVDSYNDIAVWGNAPFPANWNPMFDLQGTPLSMAFKLTTRTNPCPPGTIICPPPKTVECGLPWNFDNPRATNDCCGTNVTLTILNTVTNGVCPQLITRTWLVTDCSGFTGNCSQTVTVVDTTPPTMMCPTNRTVECGSTWSFGTPFAFDTCCLQGVSILATVTNGDCPQLITQTWLARDCCGNTNTCSQTITVVDTTPPTLTCAGDKTVQCGNSWTFDPPFAFDSCCSNVAVTMLSTFTNGICPQLARRTWLATDCCGNTNICAQTVTLVDTTPPVITCSSNKTVQCGSAWTFDPPTATDNCCTNPTIQVLGSLTNGVPCDLRISRLWVAVDCCNNSSLVCTQTVSVVDTIPPVINCPTNRTIGTCGTNAVATWTVSATDNCATNITIVSTPPSGSVFAVGTTNVVQVYASDNCGNTNTCSFTVVVERPRLTITHNGAMHTITVTWSGGILQQADHVLGPYSDVPLAVSPYTTPAIGPHKFYRTRCP